MKSFSNSVVDWSCQNSLLVGYKICDINVLVFTHCCGFLQACLRVTQNTFRPRRSSRRTVIASTLRSHIKSLKWRLVANQLKGIPTGFINKHPFDFTNTYSQLNISSLKCTFTLTHFIFNGKSYADKKFYALTHKNNDMLKCCYLNSSNNDSISEIIISLNLFNFS
jgi:hypothetical protein